MTWQHKFKCMNCGLHFIVLSWEKDWYEKNSPMCPECGRDSFAYWIEETSDPIYALVPGSANLVAFGVKGGS